jgi:hypothetical protein
MEEDFSALTADAITEILARSVSADDLAKFGAASKGTTAATQAQDFWKRATVARFVSMSFRASTFLATTPLLGHLSRIVIEILDWHSAILSKL